jgi:hypothetical protein
MKKSLLLVPLVLSAIALPVNALTVKQAEEIGFRDGMEVCRAIARGAKNMTELVLLSRVDPHGDRDYINWINQLPNGHPIYEAFRRGSNQGTEPCVKQWRAVAKRGWK